MRKITAFLTLLAILCLAVPMPGQDIIVPKRRPVAGGGPPGPDFVSDSFTASFDVDLASHTPELGGPWVHHPHANYTVPFSVDSATDRIFSTGTSAYFATAIPPSANQEIEADFCLKTAISQNVAVAGRMDATNDTMYTVRLNSGTTWEMRSIVQDASPMAVTIGSSTLQVPAVGTCVPGKFIINGDQLSFIANSVTVIGPITNTAITGAGRVGVRNAGTASATTGAHLDNFRARGL